MGSKNPSPEPLDYFSFIHSRMSAGVPKKEPSYIHMGKNIRSPSTQPLHRWKAYTLWGAAWFPKGIITTLLSLPRCHEAFGTIPSTVVWVDQSPISQHVSWQTRSGCTLHNCYRLPRDPAYSQVQKIPKTAYETSTRKHPSSDLNQTPPNKFLRCHPP